MALNIYCPFCGVILLPDPYEFDPPSPQIRIRPWYAQVRGIYATDPARDHIFITGLGVLDSGNTLRAPLDSNTSYVDVGWEDLEEWGVCRPSEGRWCFGFHDSCWRLLLLRLGHGRDDGSHNDEVIAESVFYQLYCTPFFEAFSFQFGHDYLGAAQTHKPFGRPKPVDPSSSFYADPCAIPSAHDLEMIATESRKTESGLSQRITIAAGSSDHHRLGEDVSSPLKRNGDGCSPPSFDDMKEERRERPSQRKTHILDKLSAEMTCEVLSYLSFSELLRMRLICHDLSPISKIDTIPQSYWRSRFYLGQEGDFLFPNLTDTRDWSLLFFGTRKSLRAGVLPLVNRKRIRRLLEPIAALVEVEAVFRHGPYGLAVLPAQDQANCFQLLYNESTEESPQFVNGFRPFSGKIASMEPDKPLNEGCRVLYHRTLLYMPPCGQHQRRFGISMVRIGVRDFISGINLAVSQECDANGGRLLGFHNPASVKWVEIPATCYLKALGVAFCSGGLTGLEFIFANSESSGWVGVSNGPGIAIGTLDIPEGRDQYCLLASFDHFKIVSLGFGKLANDCKDLLEIPYAGIGDLSRVQSHLWTSHPPTHKNLIVSTLLPLQPSHTFEPLINLDLGGPRGVLLKPLTSLAFHMASRPYPLMGIEVSYLNGRSMLFGSRSGCVLSVFVNGPEGERINQIDVLEDYQEYSHPAVSLGGLQVSTNFGRTATFAPLRVRSSAFAEKILVPPHGHTITGFTAIEREHYGDLVRVGIQSQPCGEQPPIPRILNHECHLAPEDQLQCDVKFSHFINSTNPGNYQTYASLKNVRRIQASIGIEGRSRSATRISGLKLEYHDHPSPGIVGQWMNPLDDSFELSPGEDIQSLTTWRTPMGTSTECPGLEIGQVVAIQIETTRARSAMFRSPGFHDLPPRKLRHQHRANSDETLTAISWIMNASSECVRAVISANTPARRAQIAIPEPIAPFDQICKLDFESLPAPHSTTTSSSSSSSSSTTTNSSSSSRVTLATVKSYFQSHAIIGLAFIYTTGSRVSIGDLDPDTTTCKTIHFAPHAHIVGLSATVAESNLTGLTFELEFNQHTQARYDTLVLSNAPPGVDIRYDRRYVWCKNGDDSLAQKNSESPSPFSRDILHAPPARTRLVGMYLGCQGFRHVGALYEPENVFESV